MFKIKDCEGLQFSSSQGHSPLQNQSLACQALVTLPGMCPSTVVLSANSPLSNLLPGDWVLSPVCLGGRLFPFIPVGHLNAHHPGDILLPCTLLCAQIGLSQVPDLDALSGVLGKEGSAKPNNWRQDQICIFRDYVKATSVLTLKNQEKFLKYDGQVKFSEKRDLTGIENIRLFLSTHTTQYLQLFSLR